MTNEDAGVEAVLAERGAVHGDWQIQSACTAAVRDAVFSHWQGVPPPPAIEEAVNMIAHKLGRAAAGDAFEPDHWRDIAGYATLAAKAVSAGPRPAPPIAGGADAADGAPDPPNWCSLCRSGIAVAGDTIEGHLRHCARFGERAGGYGT